MSTDEPPRLEDVFAGHVELTARQRAYVLHALEEMYVRGETPIPFFVDERVDRRSFHRALVAALVTPLRLTRMVTPDGTELVSPEEHRARFERGRGPADANNASALAAQEVAAWEPFDRGVVTPVPLPVAHLGIGESRRLSPVLPTHGFSALRVDRLLLARVPDDAQLRVAISWRGLGCTCYLPDDRPDAVVFLDTPVLRCGADPGDLVVEVTNLEAGRASVTCSLMARASTREHPRGFEADATPGGAR